MMAKADMRVTINVTMPTWRIRLARVVLGVYLPGLAIWIMDGAPIYGRVGNRQNQLLGRISATRLGVTLNPKRLMGADLPPRAPGTVALEDLDDRNNT